MIRRSGRRSSHRTGSIFALDLNLTKKLDELSDEELIALRDRYAALATGAPKLIEHLAEQENSSDLSDDQPVPCG